MKWKWTPSQVFLWEICETFKTTVLQIELWDLVILNSLASLTKWLYPAKWVVVPLKITEMMFSKRQNFEIFILKNTFLGLEMPELQKQPPKGLLIKRWSANMQEIYRRTPMPMCDFNKVVTTLLKSHFGICVLL